MGIYGDLRADSATQFAYDFSWIDTLAAIRAGATIPEQEVTYVRACRTTARAADICGDQPAPPTNSVRAQPKTYLFDLPARGATATASVQLCNPRGCDDKVMVGSAVVRSDGAFYSVATPFRGANRVRVYLYNPQINRVRVIYSDGLVGFDVPCNGVGSCSAGDYDESLAPFATVQGLTIGGSVIASQLHLIRGTVSELLAQQRTTTTPVADWIDVAPLVAARTSATVRGTTFRTGEIQETGGISARTGTRDLTTPVISGAWALLRLHPGALPENGAASLALLDITDVRTKAPAPPGVKLVFGAYAAAFLGAQPLGEFQNQVMLNFTVPKSAIPTGASYRDLSVVVWDGTNWTTASDSSSPNADGSTNVGVWFKKVGFYAVVRDLGSP